MTQERQPVIAGFSLPATAGVNRAAVRAGCKGQHPFPRAPWGGDAADALGVPDDTEGELHRMRGEMSLRERFHEKYEIVEPGGCWVWMGALDGDGYGKMQTGSRTNCDSRLVGAHRLSWEIHNGTIPPGKGYHGTCVLHRCDNPPCVNPEHLFLGSNADNNADKIAKGRGRCLRGAAHGRAKLTDAEVARIRGLNGTLTHREISKQFGVSHGHVSNLISGAYRPLPSNLHSTGQGEGALGDRMRQAGVGRKLANTDSSLCRVEFNAR